MFVARTVVVQDELRRGGGQRFRRGTKGESAEKRILFHTVVVCAAAAVLTVLGRPKPCS